MVEIGFALSSEEHGPNELVQYARRAEEAGFSFALISDHFHPWIDQQGQSPFVWSVIGGIAQATERLRLGTGVTCPTIRIHPAIIAQATATVAAMMPGRFFFGVGTGENLNEHILGDRWPPHPIRMEMLQEALEIIRMLWEGGTESYWGDYYTVENARLYTIPEEPPPIYVAAGGSKSAEFAGQFGDGLITTTADKDLVRTFDEASEGRKPRYGQFSVCLAKTEAEARRTAFKWWPIAALKGELSQELPTPTHFEQASGTLREEDVGEVILCSNDPEKHVEKIREFEEAGFDHVYIHQIGLDQDRFFKFYEKEILANVGAR